ncbi:DUF4148 domain-containing protein [Paraburkholderia sp.]|uniref:DUF4148 domain-containing protein n=1 Tax=Paraburkholderia sp. TaxID=1926495 RepID=UPI003D702316
MKKFSIIAMSFVAIASASAFTNAYAQEKTRAEVRQELIQAENNGSRLVTDTSYPDVNPIFAQQLKHQQQQQDAVGAQTAGTSDAGTRMGQHDAMTQCVGPVSYCTLYFGS